MGVLCAGRGFSIDTGTCTSPQRRCRGARLRSSGPRPPARSCPGASWAASAATSRRRRLRNCAAPVPLNCTGMHSFGQLCCVSDRAPFATGLWMSGYLSMCWCEVGVVLCWLCCTCFQLESHRSLARSQHFCKPLLRQEKTCGQPGTNRASPLVRGGDGPEEVPDDAAGLLSNLKRAHLQDGCGGISGDGGDGSSKTGNDASTASARGKPG